MEAYEGDRGGDEIGGAGCGLYDCCGGGGHSTSAKLRKDQDPGGGGKKGENYNEQQSWRNIPLKETLSDKKLLVEIEIETHTRLDHVCQDKDWKSIKRNKYWDSLESRLEVFFVIHLLELCRL